MQFLREIVTVIYSVNFVGFCVHSSHGFIAWAFLDQGYALILVHHCGKCLNSSVKWSWTLIFLDYFSLSRLSFTQWVYWGPTEIPRILKTLYFYTGIFIVDSAMQYAKNYIYRHKVIWCQRVWKQLLN